MQTETPQSRPPSQDLSTKARDLGSDLKGKTTEVAQSAAETVKTQADNIRESARELASDAGEKMKAVVADQKMAGADYVSNFAQMVRRASFEFDSQMPQAGHYLRKAAAQIDSASTALRSRDVSELVGEVQDFARKQPAAFFGAAVLAGFAAVRFVKSAPERRQAHSDRIERM
jgi:transcriptional regulator of heat shock response